LRHLSYSSIRLFHIPLGAPLELVSNCL
jgi:hypothetical protein